MCPSLILMIKINQGKTPTLRETVKPLFYPQTATVKFYLKNEYNLLIIN